jgi:hypothetical protein
LFAGARTPITFSCLFGHVDAVHRGEHVLRAFLASISVVTRAWRRAALGLASILVAVQQTRAAGEDYHPATILRRFTRWAARTPAYLCRYLHSTGGPPPLLHYRPLGRACLDAALAWRRRCCAPHPAHLPLPACRGLPVLSPAVLDVPCWRRQWGRTGLFPGGLHCLLGDNTLPDVSHHSACSSFYILSPHCRCLLCHYHLFKPTWPLSISRGRWRNVGRHSVLCVETFLEGRTVCRSILFFWLGTFWHTRNGRTFKRCCPVGYSRLGRPSVAPPRAFCCLRLNAL